VVALLIFKNYWETSKIFILLTIVGVNAMIIILDWRISSEIFFSGLTISLFFNKDMQRQSTILFSTTLAHLAGNSSILRL